MIWQHYNKSSVEKDKPFSLNCADKKIVNQYHSEKSSNMFSQTCTLSLSHIMQKVVLIVDVNVALVRKPTENVKSPQNRVT